MLVSYFVCTKCDCLHLKTYNLALELIDKISPYFQVLITSPFQKQSMMAVFKL